MEEGEKTSEAWNVAQGFTQLKILKPLVEMDRLVRQAKYGSEHLEEAIGMNPQLKTQIRIDAINRLIDILRETIENSEFACDKEGKEKIKKLEDRVLNVQAVIDAIKSETSDQRTNAITITINESHFNKCLEELRRIKKLIPIPLNENGLIFQQSDELDLDKLKNNIIEGG